MKHNMSTGEVLHFTEHKKYKEGSIFTGKNKMEGMCSLNTSSLTNKFCQKMSQNKDTVCSRCYARKLEKFRAKIMGDCFDKNGKILIKKLKDVDVPVLSLPRLRFSAFGELEDRTHYYNYVAIAEANPNTTCSIWTKRSDIIKKYKVDLPNLIHIYSAPKLNTVSGDEHLFNKIFTVFNSAHITEKKIDINCEQFCISCLKCYTHNDIKYINEKVRSA
jgi:hypothetical protein